MPPFTHIITLHLCGEFGGRDTQILTWSPFKVICDETTLRIKGAGIKIKWNLKDVRNFKVSLLED